MNDIIETLSETMIFHENGSENPVRGSMPGTVTNSPLVRYHSGWLSRMVRRQARIPRIPVRRVTRGGYALLLARPGGRDHAERWWRDALESTPD